MDAPTATRTVIVVLVIVAAPEVLAPPDDVADSAGAELVTVVKRAGAGVSWVGLPVGKACTLRDWEVWDCVAGGVVEDEVEVVDEEVVEDVVEEDVVEVVDEVELDVVDEDVVEEEVDVVELDVPVPLTVPPLLPLLRSLAPGAPSAPLATGGLAWAAG